MKTALKVLGALVLLIVLSGAGFYTWASTSSSRTLGRTVETHTVDFPIPFPLDSAEAAGLAPEAARQLALERARERGRHLVSARYVCVECHGKDLGGGVMIDAPVMGRFFGPNLTTGQGSATAGFTAADWDRIVRHGVRRDGRPAAMPAEDFMNMSDQELSDIVAHIGSLPAVDRESTPSTLGPMGKVLMATGKLTVSADEIGAHDQPHAAAPPATGTTVEFGAHLANVCTGCHGKDLAGGPIVGGDPSWPPAQNLTPHEGGLADWTYQHFVTAMREGRKPNGDTLLAPMNGIMPYAKQMQDVELQALWMYLRSLPKLPTPR
jgi:mono/diheme cytochrome c family protein